MEEKVVRFDFAARYFTAGNLNAQTKQVWIVFHGYGHLASYFLKKFESLTTLGIYVIAPEGLSRFYLSELTNAGRADNRVGATWMTRENRLMDIDNYIKFLGTVYEKELTGNSIPVTMLAFSQGCATACRWVAEGNVNFERLILWAGLFPPDMDFEKGHKALKGKKTYVVVGKDDPYLTPERMKEQDDLATKLNITPEKVVFEGKHELNEEVLRRFASG